MPRSSCTTCARECAIRPTSCCCCSIPRTTSARTSPGSGDRSATIHQAVAVDRGREAGAARLPGEDHGSHARPRQQFPRGLARASNTRLPDPAEPLPTDRSCDGSGACVPGRSSTRLGPAHHAGCLCASDRRVGASAGGRNPLAHADRAARAAAGPALRLRARDAAPCVGERVVGHEGDPPADTSRGHVSGNALRGRRRAEQVLRDGLRGLVVSTGRIKSRSTIACPSPARSSSSPRSASTRACWSPPSAPTSSRPEGTASTRGTSTGARRDMPSSPQNSRPVCETSA